MFPVAWVYFYLALAVSAARISDLEGNKYGLAFWSLHIALNTLWTPVFFGARYLRAGMVIITMLWLAAAATIYCCLILDRFAGLIILPYIAWVTFAAALNFSIMKRNQPTG